MRNLFQTNQLLREKSLDNLPIIFRSFDRNLPIAGGDYHPKIVRLESIDNLSIFSNNLTIAGSDHHQLIVKQSLSSWLQEPSGNRQGGSLWR
jgi:hypothetical protein